MDSYPDDEIYRIVEEGLKRTEARDWSGARTLFQQALTHDMQFYRRAFILKNVVLTYSGENNKQKAHAVALEGIEAVDKALSSNLSPEGQENAQNLRWWFEQLEEMSVDPGSPMPVPDISSRRVPGEPFTGRRTVPAESSTGQRMFGRLQTLDVWILENPKLWRVLFGLLLIPGGIWLWDQRIFVGQNGSRVWTPEIVIVLAIFIFLFYKFIYAWLCVPVTHLRGRSIAVDAAEGALISADDAADAFRLLGAAIRDAPTKAEFTVELRGDEATFLDSTDRRGWHLLGTFMSLPISIYLAIALGNYVHRSDKRLGRPNRRAPTG